jgi:TolB-like protein/Tfp pilus assembly protein PilF
MIIRRSIVVDFFGELRRREVFGAAAYYFAISWGFIEILEWVLERWQVSPPTWLMPLLATALVVGFPVSMFLAWMYDFDRKGIHRTASSGKKGGATLLMAAMLMIGGTAGLYYLIGSPETPKRVLPPGYAPKFAVLPFEALGGSVADFAGGIHFDLTRNLGQLTTLRVISRQSVMPYRETDKTLQQIAEELEVDGVLTGVVQRSGERVRLAVSLRDGHNDQQLWDEEFEFVFSPENFFEVQVEIADTVAGALEASLSDIDRKRLQTAPTRSVTAYEAYLQGQILLASASGVDAGKAEKYFQEAIRIDPDFAPAYAGLADAYMVMSRRGGLDLKEANEAIGGLVEKALELDDRLIEAWVIQADLLWRLDTPLDQVEAAYQRALELGPNHVRALMGYHYFLKVIHNDFKTAQNLLKRALELNPRSTRALSRMAEILEEQNRPDEAIAVIEKLLKTAPNHVWGNTMLGILQLSTNPDFVKAWGQFLEVAEYDVENAHPAVMLGYMAWHLQDFGTAQRWLEEAWSRSPDQWPGCDAKGIEALMTGRSLLEIDGPCLEFFRGSDPYWSQYLRDRYLAAGEPQLALEHYRKNYPAVLEEGRVFQHQDYRVAVDLYPVLMATGDGTLAETLLDKAEAFIEGRYRMSSGGYQWADVHIHALRGDTEKALAAMRGAIDDGLRWFWIHLEDALNLQSLWDEPEFQAMLAEVEADMIEWRERVREAYPNSVGPLPTD